MNERDELPEFDYPREQAEALLRGIHPHEARPRSGQTFLHERDNWEAEIKRRDEREAQFVAGVRELLEQACGLKDGLWGWYFRCRYCQGRSPDVGLKNEAHEEAVEHQPDCVAVRMRDMVTSKITRL